MRRLREEIFSSRTALRYLGGALLALGLLSVAAPARADTSSIQAGVGLRLIDGDAHSTVHVRYASRLLPGMRFHVGIDGFVASPGTAEGLQFAGGQAGLTATVFGFGPLSLEGGVAVAWNRFLPDIHGFDDSYLAIHGEVGVRATFGVFEARAAWTMPVMPLTQAVGQHAYAHQFMLTAGIRF